MGTWKTTWSNVANLMAVLNPYKVYAIETGGIDAIFKSYKVASNIKTSAFQARERKTHGRNNCQFSLGPQV